MTRQIMAAPALAPLPPAGALPGPQVVSDDDLQQAAGELGTTIFHPVGTCAMGAFDANGRPRSAATVLDTDCRVSGRRTSRGRCFGDAHHHLRQHQRPGDAHRRACSAGDPGVIVSVAADSLARTDGRQGIVDGGLTEIRGFSRGRLVALCVGIALVWSGLSDRSWWAVLAGIGVLAAAVWRIVVARRVGTSANRGPGRRSFARWPRIWPARLIRHRSDCCPPDEKTATIAHVATTQEELSRLIAEKPPAWPWALFSSVLVLRRNAVGARLRNCVSGSQPRPGMAPMSGQAYLTRVVEVMSTVSDLLGQAEQFVRSPAFTGAFGPTTDMMPTPTRSARWPIV